MPLRVASQVQALLRAAHPPVKRVTVEGLRELLRKSRSAPRGARRRGIPPEERVVLELRDRGIEGWIREHRFDPPRRWRFDFAWCAELVALEVHGAVHAQGRHTRGPGFVADREKMNRAAVLGWIVLEVTPEHLRSGEAFAWLQEALDGRGGRGAV